MTLASGFEANLSEETRRTVEREVAAMVDAAYRDAMAMLREHRPDLERLASALLEREQLDRDGIEDVLGHLAARRVPSRRPASAERIAPPVVADDLDAVPQGRRRRRVPVAARRPSITITRPSLGGAVAYTTAFVTSGMRGVRMFKRSRTRHHGLG